MSNSCNKPYNNALRLMKINREASKENIVAQFQSHLGQAGSDDTALFYFSGHGSQEPAGQEFWEIDPDRQLETLVCHDSRAGNVTDLANKELRYLISQVSDKGAEVVIIIDSCHSGHASREIEEDDSATRQTAGQTAPRALKDFIFFDDATQQGWINDLANIPQGQHIILSACRDIELSKEKKIDNQRQGIFTYSLCTLLNRLPNSLSYHNVLMRVRAATHKLNTQQTPQIEAILDANTEQLFLGKDIQPIQMISSFKNGQWELDAGLIHGIKVGDEVALKDDKETTLCIAKVADALAGYCILTNSNHPRRNSLKSLDELDQQHEGYPSDISHRNIDKLRFSTEGDETGIALLRASIKTLSNDNAPSDFIIEIQGDEIAKGVDYKIKAEHGKYTISDAANINFRPLFEPVPKDGDYDAAAADEVLLQLEHLKRWQQKLELENICDDINIDAVQLVVKYNDKELIDDDVHLRYDYRNANPKPHISLEIRCDPSKAKADVSLYCALLLFDAADASVTSLFKHEVKLIPPNTSSIFYKEGKKISVQVKDELFNNGINETEDFLKLIVSDKPFDAILLAQKGLEIFKGGNKNIENRSNNRGINDALHNLLDQELHFAHTRSFDIEDEAVIPQWFTKTVKLTTTRPLQAVEINANTAISLSSDVLIEPHPSLAASVRLSTLEDATRSLDSSAQNTNITPPIFRDDDLTPPFSFSNTRSVETDLNILELYVDSTKDAAAGGIDSVSSANPLLITIGQALNDDETILAYSYDGKDYLPLGCSRASENNQTNIVIERLPTPHADNNNDDDDADKSLFGSIKIMFQRILHKKFGIFQDPTRIARPLFENPENVKEVTGYMDDRLTLKQEVKDAKSILLIIHGIIGSTHSMAGFSREILSSGTSLEKQYDCILTFDYENLNQPIQETAEILKKKLADIGITKGHGKQLDIVAHSMGGLVSRCFIEFNHGDEIVSKLVMLGTPNGGSEIASSIGTGINLLGDWANNTLAAIINGYITNGMGALAVSGLVKLLNTSSRTLAQLEPRSDLLQLLAKSHQTAVPYYIVAGDTEFLIADAKVDTKAKFMQRMTQKLKLLSYKQLTHWLYKSPNDIAATVKSIQQLPKDWQQQAQMEVIACSHTSYFVNNEVLQVLENTLLEQD